MGQTTPYILPLAGLKNGIHHYKFVLSSKFFQNFEQAPVDRCGIKVKLQLDKRHDMLVLSFVFNGLMAATCDRCAEAFHMPIKGKMRLLGKYVAEGQEQPNEDAEIFWLARSTAQLDISHMIYELIVLHLPIKRTHPLDENGNLTCNPAALKYLSEEEEAPINPIWAELKKLKD